MNCSSSTAQRLKCKKKSFYLFVFIVHRLPVFSHESSDTDKELAKDCSLALCFIAQTVLRPSAIGVALKTVHQVAQSGTWKARIACLEFLQVTGNPLRFSQMRKTLERFDFRFSFCCCVVVGFHIQQFVQHHPLFLGRGPRDEHGPLVAVRRAIGGARESRSSAGRPAALRLPRSRPEPVFIAEISKADQPPVAEDEQSVVGRRCRPGRHGAHCSAARRHSGPVRLRRRVPLRCANVPARHSRPSRRSPERSAAHTGKQQFVPATLHFNLFSSSSNNNNKINSSFLVCLS